MPVIGRFEKEGGRGNIISLKVELKQQNGTERENDDDEDEDLLVSTVQFKQLHSPVELSLGTVVLSSRLWHGMMAGWLAIH